MTGLTQQAVVLLTSDFDEHLAFWGREGASGATRRPELAPLAARPDAGAFACVLAPANRDQRGLSAFQWSGAVPHTPLKRFFDFTAALVILFVISPLLLAVYAGLRLTEKGPALYHQKRVGQRGRRIPVFKFRTMVPNAEAILQSYLDSDPEAAREWAAVRKLTNDPRVTRAGAFLRKTSIDELPQLFNVLRGEMSLVGPRPVIAEDLERYGLDAIHYLRQRPGITGLWQVSGRSRTTYKQRVGFDRDYSLHRTIWLDLKILFRTVPAVLNADGAV